MLAGRRVVLGVSGGVAAYKSAYLARQLVEAGAVVRVVMTTSALRFVGPQTFSAITGTPPVTDLFSGPAVSPHTELGQWADVVVIAPATAATLSRIATGLSEDALVATVLASKAPLVLAPAMHTEMWEHPATRRTMALLEADGHHVVGPGSGPLAMGDVGTGRMSEPDEILAAVDAVLGGSPMGGFRVLVTAGGTREPIDPVRYLGNRSSGKMGFAIAEEAVARGAVVTLVTTADFTGDRGVEVVAVETAQDMAEAVWARAAESDVAVMAAAVADFRPADPAGTKLRRKDGPPGLELEPTPDVLAGVAASDDRPFLIGFAAETGPSDGAIEKARSKGVDLLVANDVTENGSGFGTDTNRVTIILPDGTVEPWPMLTKREVAARLWDRVAEMRTGGPS